jgi:hypothetical protein
MAKARPERIRYTLRDDAAGGIALELPSQRHWIAGLVLGVFFLIFAAVEVGMIAKIGLHKANDVFSLMMMLFDVFWLLGWSVGVFILGGLTVLFLFYRQSARIEGARLVHVPRLGPLRIVCEYDLAKMSNLRLEEAKGGEQVRVRFDYGGRTAKLGDAMTREDAQRVLEKLKSALPPSAREVTTSTPHLNPPPQGGRTQVQKSGLLPLEGGGPGWGWSSLALIGANLLPLGGVLVFDWDLGHVMMLYWAESAIVGFYTALRLCVVAKLAALAVVPFFVGHFGGFMAAHFVFVYGFFIRGFDGMDRGALEGLREIFEPVWPALVALAVSHGISFFVNFLGRREYVGEAIAPVMMTPYRRILVMHLTIIFGGWLVLLLDTPTPALALLVALKTAVDLRAHRREHSPKPAARA